MLPSHHGMMLLVPLPLVASAYTQKFPVDEGRLVIADPDIFHHAFHSRAMRIVPDSPAPPSGERR